MHARVAFLVASLAAGPISWPAAAGAVSPQLRTPAVPADASRTPALAAPAGAAAPAAWDTLTADLTIRREVVRKDGSPGLRAPEMRYRWVRTLTDGGWKTTLTLVSASPDVVRTSKGPEPVSRKIPISRIEIGDPRTPARVFDTHDRLVFLQPAQPRTAWPTGLAPAPESATAAAPLDVDALLAPMHEPPDLAARADADARAWIEQLLPSAAGRAARRAALARAMGSPEGTVRGLERFVSHADGATTEVLSDPGWAVPIEINVVREGALAAHTTFTYTGDAGAGLVRRRVRSERLVSPESGDRSVIDLEFSNIRLDRGGVK